MAKPELGTKRTCPETGKNFYDLNKDPIVSPYTGEQYPLSFFEVEVEQKKPKPEAKKAEEPAKEEAVVEDDDDDDIEEGGPEIISLEEVDEGDDSDDSDADDGDDEVIADIPEVEVELDDDDDAKADDDTFLEDEEDDTDLSDVIGAKVGDEKDDL